MTGAPCTQCGQLYVMTIATRDGRCYRCQPTGVEQMEKKPTPTLEELEAILNSGQEPPIEILANGEVRALEPEEIATRAGERALRDSQPAKQPPKLGRAHEARFIIRDADTFVGPEPYTWCIDVDGVERLKGLTERTAEMIVGAWQKIESEVQSERDRAIEVLAEVARSAPGSIEDSQARELAVDIVRARGTTRSNAEIERDAALVQLAGLEAHVAALVERIGGVHEGIPVTEGSMTVQGFCAEIVAAPTDGSALRKVKQRAEERMRDATLEVVVAQQRYEMEQGALAGQAGLGQAHRERKHGAHVAGLIADAIGVLGVTDA